MKSVNRELIILSQLKHGPLHVTRFIQAVHEIAIVECDILSHHKDNSFTYKCVHLLNHLPRLKDCLFPKGSLISLPGLF